MHDIITKLHFLKKDKKWRQVYILFEKIVVKKILAIPDIWVAIGSI